MQIFHMHFDDGRETASSEMETELSDELGIEFPDLERAYLGVCAAIPGIAQELLIKRKDPLSASCTITDQSGRILMTVPFTEVLAASEWQPRKRRRRPHEGWWSDQKRNEQALKSFRLMFSAVNAGCVLMTPEMRIVEMNDYGARHSHVDGEVIRDLPIFDIFAELRGKPKADFTRFMSLAQAGVVSEVTDLPYLVQDTAGQTAQGWWNARTWPIFDDADRLLGFIEWAEPHTKPTRNGTTEVTVSKWRP